MFAFPHSAFMKLSRSKCADKDDPSCLFTVTHWALPAAMCMEKLSPPPCHCAKWALDTWSLWHSQCKVVNFCRFYITFSVFQAHLNTILSCLHQTTGRRLCTTDILLVPSHMGGASDVSRKCQQHAGFFQRNRNWRGNAWQTTKRSRKPLVSKHRLINIAVCWR